MTRRSGTIELDPSDRLDIHPSDAAHHTVRDGDVVLVESRHGQATFAACITEQIPPGQLFCAFHFPTGRANALTSSHADTVTSCPEYKVTAVRLRGIRDRP